MRRQLSKLLSHFKICSLIRGSVWSRATFSLLAKLKTSLLSIIIILKGCQQKYLSYFRASFVNRWGEKKTNLILEFCCNNLGHTSSMKYSSVWNYSIKGWSTVDDGWMERSGVKVVLFFLTGNSSRGLWAGERWRPEDIWGDLAWDHNFKASCAITLILSFFSVFILFVFCFFQGA